MNKTSTPAKVGSMDELGICCPKRKTVTEKYTPALVSERRKEFREKKQTEVASWPDAMIQQMQLQGGVAGQCARPYELRRPAAKR